MLVPQALQDGFVAATNAMLGPTLMLEKDAGGADRQLHGPRVRAGGTDRSQSSRGSHDVVVSVARFDAAMRTIIDGRTTGFCKLIVGAGRRRFSVATSSASARSISLNWPPSRCRRGRPWTRWLASRCPFRRTRGFWGAPRRVLRAS